MKTYILTYEAKITCHVEADSPEQAWEKWGIGDSYLISEECIEGSDKTEPLAADTAA